jgi:hypothetical protein
MVPAPPLVGVVGWVLEGARRWLPYGPSVDRFVAGQQRLELPALPPKQHDETSPGHYHVNRFRTQSGCADGHCDRTKSLQVKTTLSRIGAYISLATAAGIAAPWPI